MPSMRAVLEARWKAAAVRVEKLDAELGRVRRDLADAKEVIRRRVIGLEQYLEALAEENASAWWPWGRRGEAAPTATRGVSAGERGGAEDLSVDHQAVMAAVTEAEADGPDARRTAVELGWDSAFASPRRGGREHV
ncbi:hypothetical protein [Streptomyces sp. NPDC093591]|uniref:hypothetical protein n=1 Tax=Streptomyces sp. NPDC093591 TaxID=3366044 RepID=UPI003808C6E2